ncbi:MAG: OsmC family protein [Candidatus Atabeyarchaeum deiterrae]
MTTQVRRIEFKVNLAWDGKSGGEVTLASGATLHVDQPKEFGGEGKHLCPDDLFFSAIGGCLLTTFLYMHRKSKFNLKGVHISVNGAVESLSQEGYRVKGARVNMNVETDKEGDEKARNCIEMTKRFCHITRSIEKSIPIQILSTVTVKSE